MVFRLNTFCQNNNEKLILQTNTKIEIMKKHFLITGGGQAIGLFLYTGSNEEADSLIMEAVKEHYLYDDISLSKGFRYEEYKYKPLEIEFTGRNLNEKDGPYNNIEIEEIPFYSTENPT